MSVRDPLLLQDDIVAGETVRTASDLEEDLCPRNFEDGVLGICGDENSPFRRACQQRQLSSGRPTVLPPRVDLAAEEGGTLGALRLGEMKLRQLSRLEGIFWISLRVFGLGIQG